MFDQIGAKIKGFTKFICWLGIIASVIMGFVMISEGQYLFVIGLITMIVGSLVSWISSFILYGFGELIDVTMHIHHELTHSAHRSVTPPTSVWYCRFCGQENSNNVSQCKKCGQTRSNASQ